MKIYVIRHGETDANRIGVLQGQTQDLPLNAFGRELALEAGRAIKGKIRFDAAFSSPLKRAFETAELFLSASGNSLTVKTDNRLKEVFAGDWEGKRISLGADDESGISVEDRQLFFRNPMLLQKPYPNGEAIRDVMDRTQSFLHELSLRDDLETVLISTHGFALRCMLHPFYEDQNDFWQGHIPYNCSVSILDVSEDRQIRLLESDKIYYDPKKCVDRYCAVGKK